MDPEDGIRKRIEKDIGLFYKGIEAVKSDNAKITKVLELSRMYAKDSESFLDKGDFYTSFASINYAHGLLDAVREIMG
ncbi:MAG: DUF357 domain-containing protein [Candidatus Micrarchaeota archaeon]|nr:DUF357 domain-containing protein [Candidatus Micrarchaeota archaeon]